MLNLRLAALALLTTALSAQAVPEQSTTHFLGIDSGVVRNSSTAPAAKGVPQVVWSTVVSVPGSAWLRLHYGGVLLSGSDSPGADGSYLRMTSMRDGAVQTQHLRHIEEWRETSAYFNGDSVLVELLAQPLTGENRLVIRDATAGPASPAQTDTICGPTDDRQLSSDARVARNQPTGCTSWMINDCNHCFLTAGHCAGSGLQVVQFNVPLSTSGGSIQHPPPSDQYAVDTSSLQSNGGQGVGDDWAYFGVFDNSTTGLSPYVAQGQVAFDLQPTPPSVSGQNIRITGNGSTSSPVSPTWYLVQKTHAGPYFSFTGTTVRYTTDTTGGNSGSPVIVDGTNDAIGIHTHGGCTSTGGANAGTGSNHAGLQAALANPQGICNCPGLEYSFPNGLPASVSPTGTTAIRVQLGGPIPLQAGTLSMEVSLNGGAFQSVTPVSVGTDLYDATVPASTCGDNVSLYFTAVGTDGVTYNYPTGAPSELFSAPSAVSLSTLRNYSFNTTPPGWTVVNTSLQTGAWTRGTPVDSRGPSTDADGSGQCWVTGNTNNEDVDGGPTVLTTETIDLSAANAPTVRYQIWFDTDDLNDTLDISASNDGGSTWTLVESIAAPTSGWEARSVDVNALLGSGGQFVMRFSIADQPNDSVTEGALDAFRVDDVVCVAGQWTPFGNGCTNATTSPDLQLVSLPALGTNFEVDAINLTGPTAMVVSLAPTFVPLPTQYFAPNCTLWVQPDVLEVLTTSNGVGTYTLPIPNNPLLTNTRIYHQAVDFTAPWTLSRGGIATIQ